MLLNMPDECHTDGHDRVREHGHGGKVTSLSAEVDLLQSQYWLLHTVVLMATADLLSNRKNQLAVAVVIWDDEDCEASVYPVTKRNRLSKFR